MMMPPDDPMSRADVRPVPRIEVFTGSGRRREWNFEQKAAIVAESYGPDSVSDVARRNGLSPAQLFTWRRAARRQSTTGEYPDCPAFVPAVIEAPEPAAPIANTGTRSPIVEVSIDGNSVSIWRGADPAVVTAIIGALKASK
jgi:transposase